MYILLLSGNERRFLGRPALSLVTILTELSLPPYGYLTNYARISHVSMLLARLANRTDNAAIYAVV